MAARIAIGEPSRRRRAEDVEDAHEREQLRRSHLRDAVVVAGGDQVRADETVRAGAADEERAGQEPEGLRPRSPCASAAKGEPSRGARRAEPRPCRWPYGRSPMLLRAIAHEHQHEHEHDQRRRRPRRSAAVRHPCRSMTLARNGRNTSCPVALAADSAPRTMPRRSSNHRVATTAASTIDVTPVPVPTQHAPQQHQLPLVPHLRRSARRRRPGAPGRTRRRS